MADSFDSLESMCELIVDCPHSTPKWTDEGVIVLRNQNIRNGVLDLTTPSYTNEEDYQKRIKRAVPQAGDIVFTREAPMGEVCLIPKGLKCCLGQRQVLLRPKKGISGEYLFWALQSPHVQHQISWNEGTGTTVSNVRIPVLKALKIPRHPEDEAEVAKHITAIASRIELNKQTNQTLEQMAQTLFKSWFVDFDPVIDNALAAGNDIPEALQHKALIRIDARKQAQQLPDFNPLPDNIRELFPSEFEQTDEPNIGITGWIPKGWKASELGEFIKFANGKAIKPSDDGDYPIYGANGIIGKSSEARFNKAVIVGRVGAYCGAVEYCFDDFWSSDNTIVAKSKISDDHIPFVFYLLQFMNLNQFAGGAAQPLLNQTTLNKLKVPLAGLDCLDKFNKMIDTLLQKQIKNTKQNIKLSEIRDTLLPKLISGEITLDKEVT
jgi:type I restriction enzyme S subunit